MKIIHIVLGKANPNRMNGVNKVAHNLASIQQKTGYDVEILGLTNTIETDKINRNYNIRFYRRKKYLLDPNLEKYITKIDAHSSIIHIHGGFIIDFYKIAKLLNRRHIKYIFTSHGSYNKEALQKKYFFKKIYFTLLDSYILKHAWKVQFLGKNEYDHIDHLINGINKVLIPNGQNMDELNFTYTDILSDKRPVFGFVGRIDNYHKGLDILFDGFLKYKKNGKNGILWIIGDGIDIEKLKLMCIENAINDHVIFYGSKFGNEKLNLIANMDVFVHTSRFEGFPMSVLEASGLGKPLLVSEGTNFGDYVREFDCGIVLSQNNSDEIAKAMSEYGNILKNNGLGYLSKNSKKMVGSKFSWVNISQKLLNNFNEFNS